MVRRASPIGAARAGARRKQYNAQQSKRQKLDVPTRELVRALHRPPSTSLVSVTRRMGNSRRLLRVLRAVSEALERHKRHAFRPP